MGDNRACSAAVDGAMLIGLGVYLLKDFTVNKKQYYLTYCVNAARIPWDNYNRNHLFIMNQFKPAEADSYGSCYLIMTIQVGLYSNRDPLVFQ